MFIGLRIFSVYLNLVKFLELEISSLGLLSIAFRYLTVKSDKKSESINKLEYLSEIRSFDKLSIKTILKSKKSFISFNELLNSFVPKQRTIIFLILLCI